MVRDPGARSETSIRVWVAGAGRVYAVARVSDMYVERGEPGDVVELHLRRAARRAVVMRVGEDPDQFLARRRAELHAEMESLRADVDTARRAMRRRLMLGALRMCAWALVFGCAMYLLVGGLVATHP